jgi:RNA polymerase sigma-70 factor, ECF subfamily
MELTDNEIVAQIRSGNWVNFDHLYARYLPKIYQYVFLRVRHKQTAEDLTATVFLKVVNHLPSYKEDRPFVAWIYTIARNTVIDHVRRAKPVSDLETAYGVSSGEDIMQKTDSALKLEQIKENLDSLTEVQRDVVTMRVWDELSHKEISEILKISEDSSRVTFSRAMSALKQAVKLSLLLIISGPNL